MSIKWGILGTSFISTVMAKAIQASATSSLVAIASRSNKKAKEFAEQFSIPTFYNNYHDLLSANEIDAVYIGLPNHLHKEWITHCANAGKHILCEKPLVLSSTEMLEVISVIEKSNVHCMEALMYRCHPFTKKLQDIIQSKVLGDVKLYSATYTANIAEFANPTAGGSIRNLGCYPISLVRLLANEEPIELQALGRFNLANKNDSQASIILKFQNACMAVVSTADDLEMYFQFEIYGTKGSLKVITNPWLPDHTNQCVIFDNQTKKPIEVNVHADKSLYTYQIDALNRSINEKSFPHNDVMSLQDSLGNVVVLEKWLQQLSTPL